MKKGICLIISFILLMMLAACGNSAGGNVPKNNSKTVEDVLREQMGQTTAATAATGTPSAQTGGTASDVDIDLTAMSSTMVYAEVYNMMYSPNDYIGKTVRMRGQFALYQATDAAGNVVPDSRYFACVIADATACCQQGLEFVLAGNYAYPADYPALGTDITVVGPFRTYMEGQYLYCHLTDAVMES